MNDLTTIITTHWRNLRAMTYDLLAQLNTDDLAQTLPFPTSQSLGYQFLCMLGTQESWMSKLSRGEWVGWSCSLSTEDGPPPTPEQIRKSLQAADARMNELLQQGDLLRTFPNGTAPLEHYLRLAEHEALHHGQLINFIYALELPIPESWADNWALSRDE